jgi:chromosome segregation ATPase
MAEKGRSRYFKKLVNSRKKSQSVDFGAFNKDLLEDDFYSTPLGSRRNSFENNLQSPNDIFAMDSPSLTERSIRDYENDIFETKTALAITEKKNKTMKKTIKESFKTIDQLEESNEKLKDLILSLENKIKSQENEIESLKHDLNIKDRTIENLKRSNESAKDEIKAQKDREISQMQNIIQSYASKIQNQDKVIQELKDYESSKSNDYLLQLEKAQLEKKALGSQIQGLSSEIKDFKQGVLEYESKIQAIKEENEKEKHLIIKKLKQEKDELARKLQDAYDYAEVQNSTATDYFNNELCELEEAITEKNSGSFAKTYSAKDLKISQLETRVSKLEDENNELNNKIKALTPDKSSIGVQNNIEEDLKNSQKTRFFLFWNKKDSISKQLYQKTDKV